MGKWGVVYPDDFDPQQPPRNVSPTPITLPVLRPLGLGELLDQAIRLYRRNFLKFVGILAIVQIPIVLIKIFVSGLIFREVRVWDNITSQNMRPDVAYNISVYLTGLIGNFAAGVVGFFLVGGMGTAAMIWAVTGSYLGKSIGILSAYRKMGWAGLRLIGALIFSTFVSLVTLLWFLIPLIGWTTGAGMMLFLWVVVVPLIAPAIVLEKQTLIGSVRRAWELARRHIWRTLGFAGVLLVFGQLAVSGPAFLVDLLLRLLLGNSVTAENSSSAAFSLQIIVSSVVQLIPILVYLPLQITAITVMYFDLRVRNEGLDLALIAQNAAGSRDQEREIMDHTLQARQSNLVTKTELGYFALLSAIAVVVLLVLGFAFAAGYVFLTAYATPAQ